ncbi:hypothetical protein ACFL52_05120, partial [Candidatus Margulisiibacteriota bacterium]
QKVNSIQLNHKAINTARRGAEVGIKVKQKVHAGEAVYRAKPPVEKDYYSTTIITPPSAMPKPKLNYKPVTEKLPFSKPTPPTQRPPAKKNTNYNGVKFLKF